MACYRDIPQHVSSGYFVGVGKTCDLQAVRNWDLKCILVSGGISDQGCVTQKPTWLKSEGRIHRDRALAALEQNQIIWRVSRAFQNGACCLWAAAFRASENQRASPDHSEPHCSWPQKAVGKGFSIRPQHLKPCSATYWLCDGGHFT